ncbi:hypothetical protein Tco_0429039 [Tanacetum coccineum]
MSKVLQERGFGSLPSSTKANPRDQVKSISTTIEADSYPIRHIGSSQYAVSTGQNRTLMYKTRQMTIPFPSHLNGYYCEERKGSYGPQFSKAYSEASQSIPQKEKDPMSFTLPCFINNVCFDNALVDLGASVSIMPLSTYLNLRLGELAHTKLTVELEDKTRILLPSGYQSALDPWKTIFVYTRLGEITGDDLMPTIEEGEVIEKFRTRDDELNVGIDDYPSYCDYDKKIHTDNSEEEEAETMAETIEQYMSKTRVDYGSGVVRPKIEDNDNFELKDQFLKELRTNTFSGSDHEDANEHIKKVLEIVDLFHIPNITIDQVMLRAFPMSLTGAASRWLRNKLTGSITTWEDLKTKFLSKYCPPTQTAKKMEEINNF